MREFWTDKINRPEDLRIATWNVARLGSSKDGLPDTRYDLMAHVIIQQLHCPHILAVQEMGSDIQSRVRERISAKHIADELIKTIEAKSGIHYQYCECPPINYNDGGTGGANIRNGFFYRPDRVKLASVVSEQTKAPENLAADVTLSEQGKPRLVDLNPALIRPEAPVFSKARKPLVAQFLDIKTNESYFISNLHLSANYHGYDEQADASLGTTRSQTKRRTEQLREVRDFNHRVRETIHESGRDMRAHVIVLGDFNEAAALKEENLRRDTPAVTLMEWEGDTRATKPLQNNTIHTKEGWRSPVDHIFVSRSLRNRIAGLDEGSVRNRKKPVSDHNPCQIHIAPEPLQEVSWIAR